MSDPNLMPAINAAERLGEQRASARPDSEDPMDILRFALERTEDSGVIERIMAVRRELNAERAKALFDSAMRDFQAECPVLAKGKTVRNDAGSALYQYSPLEDILTAVKPLLQKHGFSYTLDTDVESKDGWVIAKCHVTHCAGHSLTSTAKFPLGAGTRLMSTTQVYASALTFASRRVFSNAFGIVTGGEDQDGRGPKPKPDGPAIATEETRKRMIGSLQDIKRQAEQYAIDSGLIMPNQGLADWPLRDVAITPGELIALRNKILRHQ